MSINDFASDNRSAPSDPADLAAAWSGPPGRGLATAPVRAGVESGGLPEEDGAAGGEQVRPAIRAEPARRIPFASHQCDIPVAVSNPTDTDLEDLESSLDGALAARMPHYRLTGHYRSRHESLICFSNHACYGGELVTYRRAAAAAAAVSSD